MVSMAGLGVAPRSCLAISYVVADSAYSTRDFLDGTKGLGLHPVGQLLHNTFLRY